MYSDIGIGTSDCALCTGVFILSTVNYKRIIQLVFNTTLCTI
jgi:hypothetical protein